MQPTRQIYIALMVCSDADRTDIVYSGTNRQKAIDCLWNAYINMKTEDDYENKSYTKNEFTKAAETNNNSAYLQASDYHINFELHTADLDMNQR